MSDQQIENLRDEESLDALAQFCRDWLPPETVMAELGSFAGESTAVFAEHCRHVYAIDPWCDDYHEQVMAGCRNSDLRTEFEVRGLQPMSAIERRFDERVSSFDNITKLKMAGDEALRHVPEGVDFIYIDAIHTEEAVRHDIANWLPKLRSGGLIGGHDYNPEDWPGVVRAIHKSLGPPDAVYGDTSWVRLVVLA